MPRWRCWRVVRRISFHVRCVQSRQKLIELAASRVSVVINWIAESQNRRDLQEEEPTDSTDSGFRIYRADQRCQSVGVTRLADTNFARLCKFAQSLTRSRTVCARRSGNEGEKKKL